VIGDLTRDEMERVLRSQQIGRLGVTDGRRVYIFPVSYGYARNSVHLVSRPGLKLRLMRRHPEVCFEVEQIETPVRWRTVMAHGTYEEITEPRARDAALAIIAAQGEVVAPSSLAPYLDGPEAMVVYRIRLSEMTGRFEQNGVFRHA
jgi:nitroimidazol reductase NimA-like FMN-containing flavoprotein (pyridoxamine 5'-phosphate oxidase superfamily)